MGDEAANEATRQTWVTLKTGDVRFQALVDSGADMTVLRASVVADHARGQRKGRVSPRRAFGHSVSAELMYVPLGLETAEKDARPHIATLCAVTDELTEGVDACATHAGRARGARTGAETAQ